MVDQLNTRNDSALAERWVKKLDFTEVVPQLNIKLIVHPFKILNTRLRAKDKLLLAQWASVGDSVGDSVGARVWASVRDSVRDIVRDSVGDSVWAYISSFFNLPEWKYIKHRKGENPFQPCIDLWHRGVVATFDGKTWRLHGHKGKILKEISAKELKNLK